MTKEQRSIRENELNEYIDQMSMNPEEEDALREWVRRGRGIYENPELETDESGTSRSFIDYLRGLGEWHAKAYQPVSDDDMLEYFMGDQLKFDSTVKELDYLRSAKEYLKCEVLVFREFLELRGMMPSYCRYKEVDRNEELPFD